MYNVALFRYIQHPKTNKALNKFLNNLIKSNNKRDIFEEPPKEEEMKEYFKKNILHYKTQSHIREFVDAHNAFVNLKEANIDVLKTKSLDLMIKSLKAEQVVTEEAAAAEAAAEE